MDLKQLRYFLAVADAGSFAGGARRAFVKQPTLSSAVAALEEEMGGRLFERGARGVRLTPLGEQALSQIRSILRDTERLKNTGKTSLSKPLRVGVLTTLSPAFVASSLMRLQELAGEGCTWRSEDAARDVLKRRLLAGRYDLILTSLGSLDSGCRQIVLAHDAQVLAFSRDREVPVNAGPEVLSGQPLIVRTHCEQLQAASRILDERGVVPRVVARTDDDARALALVAAGIGACLIPDSFRAAGIVFVKPRGVNLKRRLGFEWRFGANADHVDEVMARM